MEDKTLIELTAQIVTAAASNKEMGKDELLATIKAVHAELRALQNPGAVVVEEAPQEVTIKPMASIKKNEVVCLICGKGGFKTLARHLKSHDITASEYKKKFGMKSSVKLVAKAYSEMRKETAKTMNLAGNLEKARAARKLNSAKKQQPKKTRSTKTAKVPAKTTAT
jgi:predicted transcriptional regulator